MLRIHQIPVWQDNYAYLIAHGTDAVVVDAPEAAPVLERARALGVTLRAVLCTHHHADHVGANEALADAGCEVIGAAHDRARIPKLSRAVEVGATVDVIGLVFRVLDVRAHTMGHIALALDTCADVVERWGHGGAPARIARLEGRPALFCGDALFAAGCGRLFEGTKEDLHASLATLARQDPRALVLCAHEYTRANLAFATHALPDDDAVRARAVALDDERLGTCSSVPSTLAEELATNPFLRALSAEHPVDAVYALRVAKDEFRP